jgi:hypothetical protein
VKDLADSLPHFWPCHCFSEELAREYSADLLTVLSELSTARIAELTEWRPIETAPKTPDLNSAAICFLGWCPDPEAPNGGDQRVIWWEPRLLRGTWWSDRDLPEGPTHWHPLPDPPALTPSEKEGQS